MKNILVLTYWSFDTALITTYTVPYVQIINEQLKPGSKIFLVTLSPASKSKSDLATFSERLRAQNIHVVNYTYRRFGGVMLFKMLYILADLLFLIVKNRVSFIHCWCSPGGAIGYILSKLTGKTLILDSCEPHAECMVESGTWKKGGLAYRLLSYLEKRQLEKADSVIYTTPTMPAYIKSKYGIEKDHHFVKPACVDLSLFDPYTLERPRLPGMPDDAIICVYAGKFGDMYLDKEVFDFFTVASRKWGSRFRVLLLTNHTRTETEKLCAASGFDKDRVVQLFVPHHQVPTYMSLATFGICPLKPIPSKKFSTPIKNGEYWAMGLPVVITKDISVDSDLITKENIGYVLADLTEAEYLNAIEKIDSLLNTPGLKERIRKVAISNRSFTLAEAVYRQIYG
jgi:glycosyltransferase involved in cell wall biosynthesis